MQGRSVALMGVVSLLLVAGPEPSAQRTAEEIRELMLQYYNPDLVRQAQQKGLYDPAQLPISRDMNPYFIRGDFNGDGEMDVAFWVTNRASGLRGVAIIHSTLDTLYVFGAGRPRPPGGTKSDQVWVDAWHLLPIGYVEDHPLGNIPEIGVVYGQPFTFERETLEFIYLGKSAFVFYWAKGQYWEFWTAD
jgi:hypothetical protein